MAWSIFSWASMASSTSSWRLRFCSRVQSLRRGSYWEGLLVMLMRHAHSARVSSDTSLWKYIREAVCTP